MAYMTVLMENPLTGENKIAPVGYSWTTLFFGFFPAAIRGDAKWGIIQFILQIVTWGISGIVFSFIYNKLFLNKLIEKGYKARITENEAQMISAKIGRTLPTFASS